MSMWFPARLWLKLWWLAMQQGLWRDPRKAAWTLWITLKIVVLS